MNQHWHELSQLIDNSELPLAQFQAERIAQLALDPTLPAQLIIQTICQGAVYLTEQAKLNIPTIHPKIPLSANQHLALEMALSNSAIALIAGSAATGKTRIAINLVHAAISKQKRVLILTHHHAALSAYRQLPSYLPLTQQHEYCNWLVERLRSQYLAQPQMDYLPLHLLADRELAKLRTPAKLETWLPVIHTNTVSQLVEHLRAEFPHLSLARLQLLAYRLKQLESLLQQQLSLSQIYSRLSDQAVVNLAEKISEHAQIPVLGTVDDLMQQQSLWQTTFDLVIVEQAHYLSWIELLLLSSLGQKLVLLGEDGEDIQANSQKSVFSYPCCFSWLAKNLLPAYRCHLLEQFRLHSAIALPVYQVISKHWMQNQYQSNCTLPQLQQRLVWHDVPTQVEEYILQFMRSLEPQLSSQVGIITFTTQSRDWLQANCSSDADTFIGTVADWAGSQRAIALVCCTHSDMNKADFSIALTRGQEYLILFGDRNYWQTQKSPLRDLLFQSELHKERTVVLS